MDTFMVYVYATNCREVVHSLEVKTTIARFIVGASKGVLCVEALSFIQCPSTLLHVAN